MKDLLKKFLEGLGLFVDFENQTEPDDDVNTQKSEKIIGEMNDLEKSLYTFIQAKKQEDEDLIEKLKSADKSENTDELQKLSSDYAKNHRVIDLALKIMWTSIESRFETSKEATGTGLRKGFKVVETFEDKNPSISSMMIPGIGMMISIRG